MCPYAIKVWVLKKLPLEEHIHKLRTQPLVSVLRQLRAPTQPTDSHDGSLSHMRFRDLHAPTWVRNRPLTLAKARRRLQQDLIGVRACKGSTQRRCTDPMGVYQRLASPMATYYTPGITYSLTFLQ